jgi:uncharacterized protein (DUF1800 family)
VASALRASDADVGPSRQLLEMLNEMGELPYLAQPPTGYPDEAEDWSSSGALLQRMNFAIALGMGQIRGVRVPAPGSAEEVFESVLPGLDTGALETAIAEEMEMGGVPLDQRTRRTLGLALGSPEFQRR